MRVQVDYWHWAGSLIGLCGLAMALAVTDARGEEHILAEFDAPPAQGQAPGAQPGQPPASTVRQSPPAPVQSRRRVDPEGDTPISNFDSLAAGAIRSQPPPAPPHPLAAAHPDHTVIVCLAGCPAAKPSIVFMAAKPATSDAAAPAGPATPAANSPASTTNAIECVAGCYSGPRSYSLPDAMPAAKTRDALVRRVAYTATRVRFYHEPHRRRRR